MARRKDAGRLAFNSFCLLLSGLGLGWLVGLSVSPVIQTILASLVAVVVSISSALAGLRASDSEGEQDAPQEGEANKPRARRVRRSFPILLDPLPVMSMVVGLACGASVGVYARANGWLAARTNSYVAEWKETGLSAQEITTRVFNSLYPPPAPEEPKVQEPVVTPPSDGQNSGTVQPAPTPGAPQPAQKREKRATTPKPAAGPAVTAERQASFREGVLFAGRLEQCTRLRNADDEDELRREMASSNFDELVRLQRICKNYECLRAGVNKACAKYK